MDTNEASGLGKIAIDCSPQYANAKMRTIVTDGRSYLYLFACVESIAGDTELP